MGQHQCLERLRIVSGHIKSIELGRKLTTRDNKSTGDSSQAEASNDSNDLHVEDFLYKIGQLASRTME